MKAVTFGLVAATLALTTTFTTTDALARHGERRGRGPMPPQCAELMTEARSAWNEIAKPELSAIKAEIDAMLTPEEKATLDALRQQAHTKMKRGRDAFKDAGDMTKEERKAAMKNLREQAHAAKQQMREDLKPIMEKYESRLKTLADRWDVAVDELRTRAEDMRERVEDDTTYAACRGAMKHIGKGFPGHHGKGGREEGKIAFLLLWNGEEPTFDTGGDARNTSPRVVVSPNPAQNTATVSFSLTAADEISIELVNSAGQRIAELYKGRLNAGNHSLPLSWGTVTPGTYRLLIKGSSTRLSSPLSIVN